MADKSSCRTLLLTFPSILNASPVCDIDFAAPTTCWKVSIFQHPLSSSSSSSSPLATVAAELIDIDPFPCHETLLVPIANIPEPRVYAFALDEQEHNHFYYSVRVTLVTAKGDTTAYDTFRFSLSLPLTTTTTTNNNNNNNNDTALLEGKPIERLVIGAPVPVAMKFFHAMASSSQLLAAAEFGISVITSSPSSPSSIPGSFSTSLYPYIPVVQRLGRQDLVASAPQNGTMIYSRAPRREIFISLCALKTQAQEQHGELFQDVHQHNSPSSLSSLSSSYPTILASLHPYLCHIRVLVALSRGSGELLIEPKEVGNASILTDDAISMIPSQSSSSSSSHTNNNKHTNSKWKFAPRDTKMNHDAGIRIDLGQALEHIQARSNVSILPTTAASVKNNSTGVVDDLHLLFYILTPTVLQPAGGNPVTVSEQVVSGFAYLRLYDSQGRFITNPAYSAFDVDAFLSPISSSSSSSPQLPQQNPERDVFTLHNLPLRLYPGSPPFLPAAEDGSPLFHPSPLLRRIESDIFVSDISKPSTSPVEDMLANNNNNHNVLPSCVLPVHLRLLAPTQVPPPEIIPVYSQNDTSLSASAATSQTSHTLLAKATLTDAGRGQAAGLFPSSLQIRLSFIDESDDAVCVSDSRLRKLLSSSELLQDYQLQQKQHQLQHQRHSSHSRRGNDNNMRDVLKGEALLQQFSLNVLNCAQNTAWTANMMAIGGKSHAIHFDCLFHGWKVVQAAVRTYISCCSIAAKKFSDSLASSSSSVPSSSVFIDPLLHGITISSPGNTSNSVIENIDTLNLLASTFLRAANLAHPCVVLSDAALKSSLNDSGKHGNITTFSSQCLDEFTLASSCLRIIAKIMNFSFSRMYVMHENMQEKIWGKVVTDTATTSTTTTTTTLSSYSPGLLPPGALESLLFLSHAGTASSVATLKITRSPALSAAISSMGLPAQLLHPLRVTDRGTPSSSSSSTILPATAAIAREFVTACEELSCWFLEWSSVVCSAVHHAGTTGQLLGVLAEVEAFTNASTCSPVYTATSSSSTSTTTTTPLLPLPIADEPIAHVLISLRALLLLAIDTLYTTGVTNNALVSSGAKDMSVVGKEMWVSTQKVIDTVCCVASRVTQSVNVLAEKVLPQVEETKSALPSSFCDKQRSLFPWFAPLLSQLVTGILVASQACDASSSQTNPNNNIATTVLARACVAQIPPVLAATTSSIPSSGLPKSNPTQEQSLGNVRSLDLSAHHSDDALLIPLSSSTPTSLVIEKYRRSIANVGSRLTGTAPLPPIYTSMEHASAVPLSLNDSTSGSNHRKDDLVRLDVLRRHHQKNGSNNLTMSNISMSAKSGTTTHNIEISQGLVSSQPSAGTTATTIQPASNTSKKSILTLVNLSPSGFLGEGAAIRSPLPQIIAGIGVAGKPQTMVMKLLLGLTISSAQTNKKKEIHSLYSPWISTAAWKRILTFLANLSMETLYADREVVAVLSAFVRTSPPHVEDLLPMLWKVAASKISNGVLTHDSSSIVTSTRLISLAAILTSSLLDRANSNNLTDFSASDTSVNFTAVSASALRCVKDIMPVQHQIASTITVIRICDMLSEEAAGRQQQPTGEENDEQNETIWLLRSRWGALLEQCKHPERVTKQLVKLEQIEALPEADDPWNSFSEYIVAYNDIFASSESGGKFSSRIFPSLPAPLKRYIVGTSAPPVLSQLLQLCAIGASIGSGNNSHTSDTSKSRNISCVAPSFDALVETYKSIDSASLPSPNMSATTATTASSSFDDPGVLLLEVVNIVLSELSAEGKASTVTAPSNSDLLWPVFQSTCLTCITSIERTWKAAMSTSSTTTTTTTTTVPNSSVFSKVFSDNNQQQDSTEAAITVLVSSIAQITYIVLALHKRVLSSLLMMSGPINNISRMKQINTVATTLLCRLLQLEEDISSTSSSSDHLRYSQASLNVFKPSMSSSNPSPKILTTVVGPVDNALILHSLKAAAETQKSMVSLLILATNLSWCMAPVNSTFPCVVAPLLEKQETEIAFAPPLVSAITPKSTAFTVSSSFSDQASILFIVGTSLLANLAVSASTFEIDVSRALRTLYHDPTIVDAEIFTTILQPLLHFSTTTIAPFPSLNEAVRYLHKYSRGYLHLNETLCFHLVTLSVLACGPGAWSYLVTANSSLSSLRNPVEWSSSISDSSQFPIDVLALAHCLSERAFSGAQTLCLGDTTDATLSKSACQFVYGLHSVAFGAALASGEFQLAFNLASSLKQQIKTICIKTIPEIPSSLSHLVDVVQHLVQKDATSKIQPESNSTARGTNFTSSTSSSSSTSNMVQHSKPDISSKSQNEVNSAAATSVPVIRSNHAGTVRAAALPQFTSSGIDLSTSLSSLHHKVPPVPAPAIPSSNIIMTLSQPEGGIERNAAAIAAPPADDLLHVLAMIRDTEIAIDTCNTLLHGAIPMQRQVLEWQALLQRFAPPSSELDVRTTQDNDEVMFKILNEAGTDEEKSKIALDILLLRSNTAAKKQNAHVSVPLMFSSALVSFVPRLHAGLFSLPSPTYCIVCFIGLSNGTSNKTQKKNMKRNDATSKCWRVARLPLDMSLDAFAAHLQDAYSFQEHDDNGQSFVQIHGPATPITVITSNRRDASSSFPPPRLSFVGSGSFASRALAQAFLYSTSSSPSSLLSENTTNNNNNNTDISLPIHVSHVYVYPGFVADSSIIAADSVSSFSATSGANIPSLNERNNTVVSLHVRAFAARATTIVISGSESKNIDAASQTLKRSATIVSHELRHLGPVLHAGSFKLHRDSPNKNVENASMSAIIAIDAQIAISSAAAGQLSWMTRMAPPTRLLLSEIPLIDACTQFAVAAKKQMRERIAWVNKSTIGIGNSDALQFLGTISAPFNIPSSTQEVTEKINKQPQESLSVPLVRQLLSGRNLGMRHQPIRIPSGSPLMNVKTLHGKTKKNLSEVTETPMQTSSENEQKRRSKAAIDGAKPISVASTAAVTTQQQQQPQPYRQKLHSQSVTDNRSHQQPQPRKQQAVSVSAATYSLPPPSFVFGVGGGGGVMDDLVPENDDENEDNLSAAETNDTLSRRGSGREVQITNNHENDSDQDEDESSYDGNDEHEQQEGEEEFVRQVTAELERNCDTIQHSHNILFSPPLCMLSSRRSDLGPLILARSSEAGAMAGFCSFPQLARTQLQSLFVSSVLQRSLDGQVAPNIAGLLVLPLYRDAGVAAAASAASLLLSHAQGIVSSSSSSNSSKHATNSAQFSLVPASTDYQPGADISSLLLRRGNLTGGGISAASAASNDPLPGIAFKAPSVQLPSYASTSTSLAMVPLAYATGVLSTTLEAIFTHATWSFPVGFRVAMHAAADYAELNVIERERTTTELRREYCRWEEKQRAQGINVDLMPLPDWEQRVPRLLHPSPILLEHQLRDSYAEAAYAASVLHLCAPVQRVQTLGFIHAGGEGGEQVKVELGVVNRILDAEQHRDQKGNIYANIESEEICKNRVSGGVGILWGEEKCMVTGQGV